MKKRERLKKKQIARSRRRFLLRCIDVPESYVEAIKQGMRYGSE